MIINCHRPLCTPDPYAPIVTDLYAPNTYTNKYIESFSINGIEFEYNQYAGLGYITPMEGGSILKPNMQVRIDYFGDNILRIYKINQKFVLLVIDAYNLALTIRLQGFNVLVDLFSERNLIELL